MDEHKDQNGLNYASMQHRRVDRPNYNKKMIMILGKEWVCPVIKYSKYILLVFIERRKFDYFFHGHQMLHIL